MSTWTLPIIFILFFQYTSHSFAFVKRFNIILATFVTPLSDQPYAIRLIRRANSRITRSTIDDARGEIKPSFNQRLTYPNIPLFARVIYVAAASYYQVPKDIDLNHYFEIINSRGEQLEKYEIIKARLIEKMKKDDKAKFNRLWGFCSEMNVYIQQKYRDPAIFGKYHHSFEVLNFDALPLVDENTNTSKISDLINHNVVDKQQDKQGKVDTFQATKTQKYSHFKHWFRFF